MFRCRHRWIALFASAFLASCAGGEGTVGNTEVNVVVPNGAPSLGGGSSAPGLIDIQSVEYTINCLGNSDTFLENNASFPDEVRLEGNLEVVDGQTSPQGPIPPEFGTPRPGPVGAEGAEIWQGFMDLPPGPCTIQLRARDNDGEVICTATEPFSITADMLVKVNLVLVCDLSYQAPVGMLDVDATFSFVVSNFCPDLFVLNCLDSNPVEQIIVPGLPPVAVTTCEVRFRDGDSTCGQSCDPQTCVVTPEGIDCTPGPDPGVSTTVTCTNAQIDCDFNPLTTETECVFTGDTLGVTPVAGPIVPNSPGAGAFAVACVPPSGAPPGGVAVCTAVTTDGDEDCNKTKTVQINCGYEEPCWQFAEDSGFPGTTGGADAACQALAGTVCVQSVCDETLQVGGSCAGGVCCVDIPAPDFTDCSAEVPPLALCIGGVCSGTCCIDDAACDDGNECTTDTCDIVSCLCTNDGAPNDGNACQPDASCGPTDGTCGGGVCTANDACSVDADCPNSPPAPADPACTAAICPADVCGATCDIDFAANVGDPCDFSGPGAADGTCLADGTCFSPAPTCNFAQTGSDTTPQSAIVQVVCTNSVTTAQSPFPWTLSVDVPVSVIGGVPSTRCSTASASSPSSSSTQPRASSPAVFKWRSSSTSSRRSRSVPVPPARRWRSALTSVDQPRADSVLWLPGDPGLHLSDGNCPGRYLCRQRGPEHLPLASLWRRADPRRLPEEQRLLGWRDL